ncbi:MAG: FAD binding domain-containing protein [Anaerolineaceae bacterium]|jgi:CO/xanthine dehydrogenase FAD-binding subunit
MPKQLREYYRPADWETAQEILARRDLRAAPLFCPTRPLAPEDWPMEAGVDLSRLGLDTIKEEDGGIKLGVLASLQSIVESDLLRCHFHALLNQCAHFAGELGMRNRANVGGLLIDQSGPSEMVLALLVLEAVVMVRTRSGALRPAALSEFIGSKTKLAPGEVACEVRTPTGSEAAHGESLMRVARTPRDQATVAIVARVEVEDHTAKTVHVAISGASPLPERMEPIEKLLTGKSLSPELLENAAANAQSWAHPAGDFRGSAEYRAAMAGTLLRRALLAAWKQAD